MAKKFTDANWDGSPARFSVEELMASVPRAVAAHARATAKAENRDVTKADLKLPFREPDGTINVHGIQAALAAIGGAHGNKPNLPEEVLNAAQTELERELKAAHKAMGMNTAAQAAERAGSMRSQVHAGSVRSQADAQADAPAAAGEGHWAQDREVLDALREAFRVQNTDISVYPYAEEIFDDYVIACSGIDGELYKIPYSRDAEGDIHFGSPVQVEEQYIEVQPAAGGGQQTVAQGALSKRLNARINEMVTDDRTRANIVKEMADAAGIEPNTVNKIINGNIERPPEKCLRSFARVLGLNFTTLKSAAGSEQQAAGDGGAMASGEELHAGSVRSQESILHGTIRQSADTEGRVWRVQALRFGMSNTRDVWDAAIFQESLPLWNGIQSYADHPTESQMRELPERSVRDVVGWFDNFSVTPQSFDADFHIKPSADWLRQDLKAAYDAGKKDLYGFSIFVRTIAKQGTGPDGKPAVVHTKIVQPLSIDVVTRAAAGGQIKYALASARRANQEEGEHMNKQLLCALLKSNSTRFALVRQAAMAAGAQGVTETSIEDHVAEAIASNETLVAQAAAIMSGPGDAAAVSGSPSVSAGSGGEGKHAGSVRSQADSQAGAQEVTFGQMPAEMREMVVAQALSQSGLPEGVIQKIRARSGNVTDLGALNREIESAREILAVTAQSGQIDNPRATVGADSADKYAIAFAKAFGLTREQYNGIESAYGAFVRQSGSRVTQADESVWNSIPPIRSIRAAYVELTGDRDLTGRIPMQQRITRQADWLTSDFTELLGSAMHKRLLRDYREVDWQWKRVATIKPVNDFKTQRAILMGYFGDLATVAQDGSYTDLAVLTNTAETYSPAKRGHVVPLTLETVVNDDLAGFTRIIGRLGRAAARTLATFVWKTLIFDNPTLASDTTALFAAGHNNLITDALSSTGLKNALTKLLSQTEPGSNKQMVISTANLALAVPPGLFLDATSLTDFNQEPQGNFNALDRTIRRLGITPINVPITGDSNDWVLAADTNEIDMVEIGFFNGMEEPEFFTQNDPTQGDSFVKDVVTKYKVRHIYGGAPVDFRGMVKSVVVGA